MAKQMNKTKKTNQKNNRNRNYNNSKPNNKVNLEKVTEITYEEGVTVSELADLTHHSSPEIIKLLFLLGKMVTINSPLDDETVQLVCMEFGIEANKEEVKDAASLEDDEPSDPANLEERCPIVTIMGHVDHGKTTLLDSIRKTNVVAGEAGGITQHIGAYQVNIKGRKITFLDTPGHEAFTAMRARGASVTDVVVIVVAADDGVMPQTKEAIDHAKAAGVPIVVAVNKMDKPTANPDRVINEMAANGVMTEEWGGDTIFVPISAKQGMGLADLLEAILLVADMKELKADPTKCATGTVIEAKLDKGRGPVATLLVQNGTLHHGDSVVVGATFGRVRKMCDAYDRELKVAGPSMPVEIIGLNAVPVAGDLFKVFPTEKQARAVWEIRNTEKIEQDRRETSAVNFDSLASQIESGEIKEIPVIIKADVTGSAEAVKSSLEKIDVDGVKVNVIRSTAGAISESDVSLANASNAIIYGFNVRPNATVRKKAEDERVTIRLHNIIYKAVEEMEAAMKGMLEPVYEEVIIGQAEVRQTYKASKIGTIAGSFVTDGKITKDCGVRLIRDGIVVYEGKLGSLKRFKDDAKEVSNGYECGITIENFNDIKEGDLIEGFIQQQVKVA